MPNLYIPICAFLCEILLVVLFFGKKRTKNHETKIFSMMILIGLIDSILLITTILTSKITKNMYMIEILNKLDYISILYWIGTLFLYIWYHSFKDNKKINNYFNVVVLIEMMFKVVLTMITLILPIDINRKNYTLYSNGPAFKFLYYIYFTYIVLSIIIILWNRKKLRSKKYIPFYILLVFTVIIIILRDLRPNVLITTGVMAYINLITYFTLENSDLKIINELNIAREEAEKANRAKTEFLANMSHEIRTPLNAITGFSQALKEEEQIPESAKNDIDDIVLASNSLLEIVNGILDISKIEANKIEIVEESYNPRELLEELIPLTKVKIGEKPIEFQTFIDKELPEYLYGDHIRIKQIILNLLTNSAKYTERGYIRLKVSTVITGDKCRLIIAVEDTGKGVREENQGKLFDKFDRLDEQDNTTVEGTGLGLSITKKLLELMHGNISVESIYGQGSKFTVEINQKIVRKEEEKKETEETEVLMIEQKNKRILVVDDNRLNIKVASKILEKYNMIVDTAQSGEECLEKVKNEKEYDIILMDIMMPNMDGKETLKELQKESSFNTPVIALTADAMKGAKEEYLEIGFHDYLKKPIEREELEQILKKY